LAEHQAGWIAPPGDVPALAHTLAEALDDPAARQSGARELVAAFHWDRVLAPLVRFCREPWVDATKDRFGQRPATVAPPDRLAFRLRRKLRVWRGRFWQGRPA
jgi:glycosyltransferase involved in cell wall biosynthesis